MPKKINGHKRNSMAKMNFLLREQNKQLHNQVAALIESGGELKEQLKVMLKVAETFQEHICKGCKEEPGTDECENTRCVIHRLVE